MPAAKAPLVEPIPGYRLLEPLGSGGFGEVWKCEAPGGLFKAIKFVCGDLDGLDSGAAADEELRAIERIKAIRHPFLLSIDRVEHIDGELLIVTELADRNLHEVLVQHQQAGRPGIPRGELLGYLFEAAEVLDLMNERHGLQHLDVKPRNLFLVSTHVKVADFGLVNSLGGGSGGAKLGAVTPLYAAPEIFLGKISPRCDQYSLAITYQELLTGTLPFQAKNSRHLLLLHTKGEPNLAAVPEEDRPILARALAKDPDQRFPSCTALVQALADVGGGTRGRGPAGANGAARSENPSDLAGRETARPELDITPGRSRHAVPAVAALTGYEFVDSVGCSPLADVWKARRPDGRPCLVRLVYGLGSRDARGLEEAVVRLTALRHPAVNPTEVVQCDPGRLVLVSDWVGQTLHERWKLCRTQKQAGVPRSELLGYLRAVAAAVDYLYEQQAIHHLGLNPRNVLLHDGRVQLAEFGLAHLFWLPSGQPVAGRNARYSAPELLDGHASRACDQFSLAMIYQEMLTGTSAGCGRQRAAPGTGRAGTRPDVSALPAADRDIVARALDGDPGRRWPSCVAFVRALEGDRSGGGAETLPPADRFIESLRRAPAAPAPAVAAVSQDALNRILHELTATAGGESASAEEALGLLPAGDGLRLRFRAGLPVGVARTQLDRFRQQWDGRTLRDEDQAIAFEVATPTTFWRQWIGRSPALEVRVQLSRPHALSATPIDVAAEVRTLHCGRKRATQLLDEVGAPLLENLRAFLLVNSEKRTQDRLLWPHPVQVSYLLPDGTVSAPIECRGKDISLSGIGFYLPHEIPTPQVYVRLPTGPNSPGLAVPATLVRANRCADGWYDIGALFRLTSLRKAASQ